MCISELPLPLAVICQKAANVLDNKNLIVRDFQIEKHTGLNHSSVYRIRHRIIDRSPGYTKMSLANAILLANYPDVNIMNKPGWGERIHKQMFFKQLEKVAQPSFGLNSAKAQLKIADVLAGPMTLKQVSQHLRVGYSTLSHLRTGRYVIWTQKVDTLGKLLNLWKEQYEQKSNN